MVFSMRPGGLRLVGDVGGDEEDVVFMLDRAGTEQAVACKFELVGRRVRRGRASCRPGRSGCARTRPRPREPPGDDGDLAGRE